MMNEMIDFEVRCPACEVDVSRFLPYPTEQEGDRDPH